MNKISITRAAISDVIVAVILPPDYKLFCIGLDENSYPLGENTAPDRPHGPSNMDYGRGIIRYQHPQQHLENDESTTNTSITKNIDVVRKLIHTSARPDLHYYFSPMCEGGVEKFNLAMVITKLSYHKFANNLPLQSEE